MMIPALALALTLAPDWNALGDALDAIAKARGFAPYIRKQPPGPVGIIYTYKREDGAYLQVSVHRAVAAKDLELFRRHLAEGNGQANKPTDPSGFPLGDFCFVFGGGTAINLGGEDFSVEGYVSAPRAGAESQRDRRLLEALARTTLAEAVGSTLASDGKALSQRFPELARSRKGYGTFASFLKKRGFQSRPNEWGDRATFKAGGRTVELALGSDVGLVNGRRFPLGSFVVRRNGEWLVPTTSLVEELGLTNVK